MSEDVDADLRKKFSQAYVKGDVDEAIEYLERIVDDTNKLFESWKEDRRNLSTADREKVLNSLGISFMILAELHLRKEDREHAIFYAVKTCSFPDSELAEMDIESTREMASLMLEHLLPKELIKQIKLIKYKQDLAGDPSRSQPLLGKIDWSGLDPSRVLELYREFLEAGNVDDSKPLKRKGKKRKVAVDVDVLATKWIKDERSKDFIEVEEQTGELVGPERLVIKKKAKKKEPEQAVPAEPGEEGPVVDVKEEGFNHLDGLPKRVVEEEALLAPPVVSEDEGEHEPAAVVIKRKKAKKD